MFQKSLIANKKMGTVEQVTEIASICCVDDSILYKTNLNTFVKDSSHLGVGSSFKNKTLKIC